MARSSLLGGVGVVKLKTADTSILGGYSPCVQYVNFTLVIM